MKHLLTFLLFAAFHADLSAARHVAFEVDVFNGTFPVDHSANAVFSPLSAEIDCVVASEAMDTISRASVAESMGVLVEFVGVYRPIMESYARRDAALRVTSARGFCVPELRGAFPDCLQLLQREYGAEVMPAFPTVGAESWFRTAMDGIMDDFRISLSAADGDSYSFYDLISVDVAWAEPFPTANSRDLAFTCANGTVRKLPFMSDVRVADIWDAREYTLLRIDLKGDLEFFAMLPKEGLDLSIVRQDFSFVEIDMLLSVTTQRDLRGTYHGPAAIVLPRLEMMSRIDLMRALVKLRLSLSSLVRLVGTTPPREYVQQMRFRLAEHGRGEEPLVEKPKDKQVGIAADTKKMVLNRPFLFFVHDRETRTIPAAGIFTGID